MKIYLSENQIEVNSEAERFLNLCNRKKSESFCIDSFHKNKKDDINGT